MVITTDKLYRLFLSSKGITTDTRQEVKDKIFFGLKGMNFDGNKFANIAVSKGCSYAVVDDPSFLSDDKFLFVNDTLKTLQDLALFHRKQLNITVIGITGTNGKTTTKEIVSAVLNKKYNVLSTKGNLNNHIGVPLSILTLKNHDFAVIEMGANHPGEIRKLCEIALPDYGIITNIGKAHLEGFGSPEGVKKTKKELYDFLMHNNGKIFINYGDPVLKEIADESGLETIRYGNCERSVCNGTELKTDPLLSFLATWSYNQEKGSAHVQTLLAGSYNQMNLLAAIAVGLYFEIDINEILNALENYTPSNNRSQIHKTKTNTLILDAYNANPASMSNALDDFISYSPENKVVILGDMLELGAYSEQEHELILRFLRKHVNLKAYLVGQEFARANKNKTYPAFFNVAELIMYLKKHPISDSLILLKGSRAIQLEKLTDHL